MLDNILYSFKYDNERFEENNEIEHELFQISKCNPVCEIIDWEDDIDLKSKHATVNVNFDIKENIGKDMKFSGEYTVYLNELSPIIE